MTTHEEGEAGMADMQRLKSEFEASCKELLSAGCPIRNEDQERLMERARPLAEAWALHFLGGQRKEEAEDIAQECCMKLLAEFRQGKLPAHTLGHFLRMIKNKVIDFIRRRKAEHLANLAGEDNEEDPMERRPGINKDPGTELDRAEAVGRVSALTAALSEAQGVPETGPVAAILQGLGELCRRLLPVLFDRHFTDEQELKALAETLTLSYEALRQQKKRCLDRLGKLFVEQFGEPAF
jgi:RNA polymerase sigma factor (sigma-70 family)